MRSSVAGSGRLLRTSLRHDGRAFLPWIIFTTFLSASSILLFELVFTSPADRMGLAVAVGSNPALGLMFGPAQDLSTADGFAAWRSLALGGFLAALGSILAVGRATRSQEDSGQAELLASGVLGRSARLLTGVAMGAVCALLVGVVAASATIASGGGAASSLLLGATFTMTGIMFTAVAALTAQLGSDARTATSLAVGTLGTLFVLCGFAQTIDGGPEWTVWVNPLGWMRNTEPASGNDWQPLLLGALFSLVLLLASFVLQARRDFGQGLIMPGAGSARGAIRTPLGLAVRLNRVSMIVWSVAAMALGIIFGYFTTSADDLLASGGAATRIFAAGATPEAVMGAFVGTIVSLVGIIISIPGVQIMLAVRSEEVEDRVEPLMATATGRTRYFLSNLLVACFATATLMIVAGTIIAFTASRADIGIDFADTVWQAVATVPAIWAVVSVSIAVVGARPRVSMAAWAGVAASFILTLLGPSFDLPDWALDVSPFRHVPNFASSDVGFLGLTIVAVIAGGLMAVGAAGFRRRDLAT
jgi:ABC-2 type transport system permease protein